MSTVLFPASSVVRFQDVRDPIRRLLLGSALYSIYRPRFEDTAVEWERDDPDARQEWDEDREMDEQCGKYPDSTDYLYALTVVNPVVGPFGSEIPLAQTEADELYQVAQQIATGRKAGRDRDEFTNELEEKRRSIKS